MKKNVITRLCGRPWSWRAVLVAVVAVTLGVIIFGIAIAGPAGKTGGGEKIAVVIRPGASTYAISEELQARGLIKNAAVFRLLCRVNRLDGKLQAGEYEFTAGMTVPQIMGKLARGEVAYTTVTIPEGYTVDQIAKLLAERRLADYQRFKQLVHAGRYDYSFLVDVQEPGNRLEGYLFPETYQIPKGMKEEDIIDVMLRRFDSTFTPAMRRQAADMGLSVNQVVTLASLVEREAKVEAERPVIAAVFLRRLKMDMPLQSCATVQYILGEPKAELTVKDTEIPSPYNTYLHIGLPPGPIASPGLAAINAVLNPADVDYLYFVAKNDGTHLFARTYAEHLENIARVQQQ